MFFSDQYSLVNLACSIMNYFGAQPAHPTLPAMDELLQYPYKSVVVLLLDGFGTDALQHHLPEDSFLRKHLVCNYSSVFPPTTTSATTSLESGLTPAEHGWLGWSLYFSEVDKIVNAFINTEKDTRLQAADYHVANRVLPYKSIYDKIKEAGRANAYSVSKFGSNKVSTFEGLTEEIIRLCKDSDPKYIYGYWEEPDLMMHDLGCYHPLVTIKIKELEQGIINLCSNLSDTLIIVTADHGHCNLDHYILTDYPKLLAMLKRPISIEARAASFSIKEEYKADFPVEFHQSFGDDFLLLSRNEVIDRQLFGSGTMHPKFEEFLGDYLAVAVRDKGIVYSRESKQFISNHAGMTKKEMQIPLIAIRKEA